MTLYPLGLLQLPVLEYMHPNWPSMLVQNFVVEYVINIKDAVESRSSQYHNSALIKKDCQPI